MSMNILLAVDTSDPDCWPIVRDAARLYTSANNTIHIVHVVPEEEALGPLSQFVPKGFAEKHREVTHKLLETLVLDFDQKVPLKLHLRTGKVYVAVLDLAQEISANIIVVAANRPDLKDYLLGPIAARIARHASCSVLVARP